MKIASIDIGTNAIKSKIFKTTPASIEFLKGMRSPIRLGSEVFKMASLVKEN
jgi:exopolyphosphatase / guanosine-5'-triphosphate,3'-diphosphate pyrophosphatase